MDRFIIRTYGLLINDNREILVTQERYKGVTFSKFPGGGVELGEGIADALIREFKEEANIEVKIENHFYTTDFYIASAFNPKEQLISVYYLVSSEEWSRVQTVTRGVFPEDENSELFTWVPLKDLTTGTVTYPIDKKVVAKLLETSTI
jgi:mutator protein MutT